LETAKGDALIAILEAMQRGRWQTEPPRKLRIRHFTPSFAQKFPKLAFERAAHIASLPERSFRMWNILGTLCLTVVSIFESLSAGTKHSDGLAEDRFLSIRPLAFLEL
jgi:hypothetical protein